MCRSESCACWLACNAHPTIRLCTDSVSEQAGARYNNWWEDQDETDPHCNARPECRVMSGVSSTTAPVHAAAAAAAAAGAQARPAAADLRPLSPASACADLAAAAAGLGWRLQFV